jgi:hypothetical protein
MSITAASGGRKKCLLARRSNVAHAGRHKFSPKRRRHHGEGNFRKPFVRYCSAARPGQHSQLYRDLLDGEITKAEDDRDFLRLGEDFYILFMYGDVPDESEFLRTARSVWLENKSDNVEEMKTKNPRIRPRQEA